MKLTVIICTYNPTDLFLEPCLASVSKAAMQLKPFELLIIDNNSSNGFAEKEYVKQFIDHNRAKLIKEERQGLTPARLRGINEAGGDILVFVDDDNIVAPDFFVQGIAVAADFEKIGAWSGRVTLAFEQQPENWTKRYWGLLVNREITEDQWSNLPHLAATMPHGAGLFIRKSVADEYQRLHESGKRNVVLDRAGESLFSAGDNDLAACACDIGLGVGAFHKIALTHFIPANRIKKEYLLRLAKGIAASAIVFKSFRGELQQKPGFKKNIANFLRWLFKNQVDKQFYKAVLRGEKEGRKIIKNHR